MLPTSIIPMPSLSSLALLVASLSPTYALWTAPSDISARSAWYDSANYTHCAGPSSLPSSFACPADTTTCMLLAANTSMICCPAGSACTRTKPITCDVSVMQATLDQYSQVRTQIADEKLPTCGDGCCFFGYECGDGDVCVKSEDQESEEYLKMAAEVTSSSSSSSSPSSTASVASSSSTTSTVSTLPTSSTASTVTPTQSTATATATATATTSTTLPATQPSPKKVSVSVLVVAIAGTAGVISFLSFLFFLLRRRRRQRQQKQQQQQQPYYVPSRRAPSADNNNSSSTFPYSFGYTASSPSTISASSLGTPPPKSFSPPTGGTTISTTTSTTAAAQTSPYRPWYGSHAGPNASINIKPSRRLTLSLSTRASLLQKRLSLVLPTGTAATTVGSDRAELPAHGYKPKYCHSRLQGTPASGEAPLREGFSRFTPYTRPLEAPSGKVDVVELPASPVPMRRKPVPIRK